MRKYCSYIKDKDISGQIGRSATDKIIRYYNWERVAKSTVEVFKPLIPGIER